MEVQIGKQEECIELKNIKYKTMLLNGNPILETKSSNNLSSLDKFLEDEKNSNKNEPWSKLDKTIKTQKLLLYVENYKKEKSLNEEEESGGQVTIGKPLRIINMSIEQNKEDHAD